MPRHQSRRQDSTRRGGRAAAAVEPPANEHAGLPPIVGCPVFDPIHCQCPKTPIGEDGVKMTCTWDACPYAVILLHIECYRLLEAHLVKLLASLGSARGWTVPQRLNNLWEKKGQTLIGKFCRCRCGRGQMTRDKQALYEKEKAVEKEKKKKAKKAKQLPMLHFNSKPAAAMEEKKRETSELIAAKENLASSNTGSVKQVTNSTRTRLFTESSVSSVRTFTVVRTLSECSTVGESNGKYRNNDMHPMDMDYEDYDDAVYGVGDDASTETIVPAPIPPPLLKSYAATIKEAVTETPSTPPLCGTRNQTGSPDSGNHSVLDVEIDHDEQGDCAKNDANQNELHDNSIEENNNNVKPVTARARIAPLSAIHEVSEGSTANEEQPVVDVPQFVHVPQFIHLQAELPELPFRIEVPRVDQVVLFESSASKPSVSWASVGERTEKQNKQDSVVDGWTPFFGRGFNLGERLMYLP